MRHLTFFTLPAICLTLAACGSSNGADVQRVEPLSFGSTNPAEAANGLDYADERTSDTDLLGQSITVNAALTKINFDTGAGQTSAEATVLEFIDASNFTIRIGGETLEFINGAAIRDNGDSLTGTLRSTEFGGRIEIRNSEWETKGDPRDLFFGDAAFGFETNPDRIAELGLTAGSTNYTANFSGNGTLSDDDGLKPGSFGTANGFLVLEANFADGTINGDLQIVLDEEVNGTTLPIPGTEQLNLTLTEADIVGNGFLADMTTASCVGATACSSNSQIGGVFNGPNAEEVAGIALLDISVTDDSGNTTTFEGAGSFVGTEPCSCD